MGLVFELESDMLTEKRVGVVRWERNGAEWIGNGDADLVVVVVILHVSARLPKSRTFLENKVAILILTPQTTT